MKNAIQNNQMNVASIEKAKSVNLPNDIIQRLKNLPIDNASKKNPGGVEYSNEKRILAVEIAVNFPELSKKDVAEIVGMKSEANVRSSLSAAQKGKLRNIDDALKNKIRVIMPNRNNDIKNHPEFLKLQSENARLERELIELRAQVPLIKQMAHLRGQQGLPLED